jgi:hypothetical protein
MADASSVCSKNFKERLVLLISLTNFDDRLREIS